MIDGLIGNDLVVNEDSCNLSCTYCLTGQSNLKEAHSEQLIFRPPTRDRYAPETLLGKQLPIIDRRIDSTFRVPLLKVTGGEIFLVAGVMDFLREQAAEHEVLVIQTNGVLVRDAHLEELARWGNVVLQVSLDSHLHQGNSHRVASAKLHTKVVERVEAILDSGLDVEIYGVLNDRSVGELADFAGWLADRPAPPVFFPFPVRGPDSQEFAVRPDQVHHIEEFAARYEEFASVLPPRAYLDRLVSFYRNSGRTFRCHLPRMVISTFSDGAVTPCPNIWFSNMGNLLEDDWEDTLSRVGESGLYQALLADRPRLDACKGCFTPWDTLSMYFDDEITLDELCSAPTYSPPAIRALIAESKRRYLAEEDGRR
ncbi:MULTISPECIES: radical SAM protein [Streptomyces]|uniref:radical SAM protein n=1 Tax=Streptomyces TaxID=1883 RepID=UPI0004C1C156|nr:MULTISPECIES: radical SAM protein [Streptomyces]MDP9953249.1 MoaA/NifB/PqqE/SkfB family radical SAM enzyme [Streptomyces sp. DSM 41269]